MISCTGHRLDTTETPPAAQPNLVTPPEFDTCNLYVEAVNPALDPKNFLLRCLIFSDEDRTRYVSVGFYATRDYEPFVEFGAVE